MRARLATALAHKDLAELARRLDEAATLNPDPNKWLHWPKLARDGAAAARRGRASAVIASCTRCHAVYRSEFLVSHRTRRLP
jgi:cytochrome c553